MRYASATQGPTWLLFADFQEGQHSDGGFEPGRSTSGRLYQVARDRPFLPLSGRPKWIYGLTRALANVRIPNSPALRRAASYGSQVHVLDDPANSARVASFLAVRAERWARTPVEQIRLSANANGPDGPLLAVPDDLIAAAVAFEERYGGLAYRLKRNGNHMEYGLDGEAYFGWSSQYGWSMPALIDGSWTWMVGLLLDGRTIMGPGEWPDRLIDRTLEQRLEKHALLTEVSDWPHVTLTYVTHTQVLPVIDLSEMPAIQEATGPADCWWYDGEAAIHLTLAAWPEGQDHWKLRCFARTKQHLPAVLSRVGRPGPVDTWCEICCRFLQPSLPSYVPQGEPGYCFPSPADQ